MGDTELREAMGILRQNTLFPSDLRRASILTVQSGIRINDIAVAIFWAEHGNVGQAKLAAKRAADAISRFIQ